MKITGFKLYKVKPRWLFLKISTDEGIDGWGEPVVEGRADSVHAAVQELSEYLTDRNPLEIERHFQTLYRGGFYRGGPVLMSAIAGIEQALWDIKGKHFNTPVHELMGGRCRDKIKVYSWIGGDRPEDAVDHARTRLEQGFRTVKMSATGPVERIDGFREIDSVVARMQALRDAHGYNLDIALDFHGRVHTSMAKTLVRELEPFRPLFYEEPVLPEHADRIGEIARHTSVPLALGERLYSRWDFKSVLTGGHIDLVQPDISHAGGFFECRKIAAMAEAYDVAIAPHCPLGPIAAVACLHLDACTPNFALQELSLGIHYNHGADLTAYLKDPGMFSVNYGYLDIPSGPGWGLDLDEEKILAASKDGHAWRSPVWSHEDGSQAEW